VKVNTYSYVIGESAACGGIFCDYRGSFLDCKLDAWTIFEAELYGIVFALKLICNQASLEVSLGRGGFSECSEGFLELFSERWCIFIVKETVVQISWLIMDIVSQVFSGGMFYPLLLARIFLETVLPFSLLLCFSIFFLKVQVWFLHLYGFPIF